MCDFLNTICGFIKNCNNGSGQINLVCSPFAIEVCICSVLYTRNVCRTEEVTDVYHTNI